MRLPATLCWPVLGENELLKNIGIDASNLRQGGGVTHLVELLRVAEPARFGIGRVIVWSNQKTLEAIEDRVWLDKVALPELEGGQIRRALWQRFQLGRLLNRHDCKLLFSPGGNYPGTFRPFVTMSRNMLPFESRERARYGLTVARLRLEVLKILQGRSFKRANGVIFLTDYARREVEKVVGALAGKVATIPHGVLHEERDERHEYRAIGDCSELDPFRIVYVSDVSP